MDLKYMVYMLQVQGTLAVKEEVVKDFLIVTCVEVSYLHERTPRQRTPSRRAPRPSSSASSATCSTY